ncbi:MAG: type II and III secretion system protein family protein [Asticcacaulis sp.]
MLKRLKFSAAAVVMAGVVVPLAWTEGAWATPQPYRPGPGVVLPPPAMASNMRVQTQSSPVKVQVLNLPKGRSAVIDLPTDAADVFVSNPAVADAVLRTPRRIFVLGVAAGDSDAIFFDGMGRQIMNLSIRVDAGTDQLADTVHRLFPHSHVEVQSLNGQVVLSGMAESDGQADQLLRLAQSFADKPEHVVNLMTIAGKDQVTLKVRIVEVNRTTIKQLGFDTSAVLGQVGGVQYAFSHAPTYGINNKLLGGITGGYKVDTTSQPVAGWPFGQVNSIQAMSALTGAGIKAGDLAGAVNSYLAGGSGLSAAQSSAISGYLANIVASTNVTVTDAATGLSHTVNAANSGISAANLQSLTAAYLSGGNGLTNDQTQWLNQFNKVLPQFNASTYYSLSAGQDSTWVDKNNPANYVGTGRAGTSGLNQGNAMIQAFERVGLVRTLAEPNLTTTSGEAAKFLAGGEFPVPVAQDSQGRITVEFKPFGVGLGFTPVVLSGGLISMKISTEVSELSNTGALQLSSTLTLPALSVRRAEDTVELQSGSSMMIAGLLQSKYKQSIDSLPGLTTLPVLGELFRSRDFQNDETELVVIVTPYIVKPTDPDRMQTPADNLEIADDLETVFMGHLNKVIKEKKGLPPQSADTAAPYQAPVGYVIE